MADEVLSEAEAQTIRDGVNYARIALSGWKDGQWERVPKGWHLGLWAEEVERLAASHENLRAERDAYHAALEQIANDCPIMNVVIDGEDSPCVGCQEAVTVALHAIHPLLRKEPPDGG